MEKRIIFTGKNAVELEDFTIQNPDKGQVLVSSIVSIMSTGTENIVFNRDFEPGTPWDDWVKYPFHPGYSIIGRVTETGVDVKKVRKGDIVGLRRSHASAHIVSEDDCRILPAGMDPEKAAWFALGHITFMGAKAANYTIGDRVLVIGAGPIGQMTIRWARALGAETITCLETTKARLEMAAKGGADILIEKPVQDAAGAIMERCGRMPNIVFDATGNAMVFQKALDICDRFGRIVLIGDTGSPSKQSLSGQVLGKGLTIVGAHDSHTTAEWTQERVANLFFKFCIDGRMNLDGLNTHSFKPSECKKAYELANTKRSETMGILFKWQED